MNKKTIIVYSRKQESNYVPVFIDIKTGGLLIPLNHSWALNAGTGAAVSGYRSC